MTATRTQHLETRHHELRRTRVVMADGNLTTNLSTVQRGLSARAYVDGYWGFASVPVGGGAPAREQVQRRAREHARAMAGFGARTPLSLASASYRGRHPAAGRALSATECNQRLAELHAWCKRRYPALRATRFVLTDERHDKQLDTAGGGESLQTIERAAGAFTLIAENRDGAPIEVDEWISCRGALGDLDWSLATLAPLLDRAHEQLQAKREAVAARGGEHTVVMAPELAGILAHEAMGHPCEADAVLGGAVTASLAGQRIASELVTMTDFAHTLPDGSAAMVPVHVDDEGTPARDVVMIDRGVLSGFMHSRETAARMGEQPTGSARAYGPHDEPLVRMRNTAILPGSSTLEQMIAGVDDGYLLLKTGNGQADATTEFMFAVTLAYEIRHGRIGRAVRNTTVSGSAIKVLGSVDAVGRDMHWTCAGYCGKKQPMVVSMGGPALRARAHLGGQ